MNIDKLIEKSPTRLLSQKQSLGIKIGEVGCVFAPAGSGKSAFLVHAGLEYVLRGLNVLHISLTDSQTHVREYYDTVYKDLLKHSQEPESPYTRATIERHRIVHSCLGRHFQASDLLHLLQSFHSLLDFQPSLVLIDNVELSSVPASEWKSIAQEHSFRIWLSALKTDAEQNLSDLSTVVELSSGTDGIHLEVVKQLTANQTGKHQLSSVSMLVQHTKKTSPLCAAQCTLYSGGAMGSEAFFGEMAEAYNLSEVNFTFEGHNQKRTRGSTLLSERELAGGSVSLAYVSKRLHRHWDRTPLLRKVLQVLWHVVSHADQIFIVGIIQQDDTVHGGTGWSVELARRWKKPVWVFDQEREGWFHWNGQSWVADVPTITSHNIAGSGTRFLNDSGRAGITDLFERSFSK